MSLKTEGTSVIANELIKRGITGIPGSANYDQFLAYVLGAMMDKSASTLPTNIGVINVKDSLYGAKGDGVTDDTNALNAAAAAIKAGGVPAVLYIPPGNYATSDTVLFDLPNGSTVDWHGRIVSSVSGKTAVQIGPSAGNAFWISVIGRGVYVERTAVDASGSSVGVELRSLVWGKIRVEWVRYFTTNLKCNGVGANGGFSYNQVSLGGLHDGTTNLYLGAEGSGFCNENVFYGGGFNHGSTYPSDVASTHLVVSHFALHRLNNNRFFCPSFEDSWANGRAAYLDAESVLIFEPRLESAALTDNYKIEFGPNSLCCRVECALAEPTNFTDSDFTRTNSYTHRRGSVIRYSTVTGDRMMTMQSTDDNDAKAIGLLDTGNVETWWADCTGVQYAQRIYSQSGFRAFSSDHTNNDRGIFFGVGSPAGVVSAQPGSIYLDAAGGAGTTLYVKESGAGNTGWIAK